MKQENVFAGIPDYIDSHVHVFGRGTEGADDMVKLLRSFGGNVFNYLSCECMEDAAQNAVGIYLKLKYPNCYAFGGFHYRYSYSFREEAERLIELGFDGIKMVENKPNLRKVLHMASNDPRYDEFYGYMEENGLPMTVHVADPEEFWDKEKIPSWAVEAGYFYGDGSFVEKETIYRELFDVLDRFPKLNVTLAHFLFLSGDRERLNALLETYPHVKLDLTAGTEMYFNFSEDTAGWREFFLKYQDRILFGTDLMNLYDAEELATAGVIQRFEHQFLTESKEIPAWDKLMKGIGLPAGALEKIYRINFLRFAGERPKEINKKAAAAYLDSRLREPGFWLTREEREIIEKVKNILEL